MPENRLTPENTSKIFLKSMSCSRALFTVLNEGLGFPMPVEQKAAHPLAGGIVRKGYQCGMLWGSTLAAGAEAFRRLGSSPQAEATAIVAARRLVGSFTSGAGHSDCRDITAVDFTKVSGRIKYLFTGKANRCRKLAMRWAPEALTAIEESFTGKQFELPDAPISCASETIRAMGGGTPEAVFVAGFAGGIGLSGGGCGALGAAIFLTTLRHYKAHPPGGGGLPRALSREVTRKGDVHPNPRRVLDKFESATGGKMLCSEITARRFDTQENHSDFLREGGCCDIIQALQSIA